MCAALMALYSGRWPVMAI